MQQHPHRPCDPTTRTATSKSSASRKQTKKRRTKRKIGRNDGEVTVGQGV